MKRAPGRRRPETKRRNASMRKLYYTARWSRLRVQVMARDRGLCQEHLRNGDTQPGNEVDHIKPHKRNPELFWNPDNLETLCRVCHARKTSRGD